MALANEQGKKGEDLAVWALELKGFAILERNYRFERNEVDIIAMRDGLIVFVEVKTRGNTSILKPESCLIPAQQERIRKAAWAFLQEYQFMLAPARFDVIAISFDDPEAPEILHFEDAFR